jgi:hypothetical protein
MSPNECYPCPRTTHLKGGPLSSFEGGVGGCYQVSFKRRIFTGFSVNKGDVTIS